MAYDDGFVIYLTKFLQLRKFTASNVRELIQKNLEDTCRGLFEGATPECA
jgi:hypothetical protein